MSNRWVVVKLQTVILFFKKVLGSYAAPKARARAATLMQDQRWLAAYSRVKSQAGVLSFR